MYLSGKDGGTGDGLAVQRKVMGPLVSVQCGPYLMNKTLGSAYSFAEYLRRQHISF